MHYCIFTTPATMEYSIYDYNKEDCLSIEG